MTEKEKQYRIDSIVKGLHIDIPIVFDPYKNATDCMQMWDRFTSGKWASVISDAVSNKWAAVVANRRSQPAFNVRAEGSTMLEAMVECMYRFFRDVG